MNRHKLIALVGLSLCLASAAALHADSPTVAVSDLALEGQIDGENITFSLTLQAQARERGVQLPLVAGDAVYLKGAMPRGTELQRDARGYSLRLDTRHKRAVEFRFAGKAVKDGEWRRTFFDIPAASVRRIAVILDRENLEIAFPGALDVAREKTKDGKVRVSAYLGVGTRFEVGWKPEIRKIEGELVVSCEASTIAKAGVGALRLDTVFTYRVVQGALSKLVFNLPEVSVTQVRGDEIQDWRIEPAALNRPPRLVVTLSRPIEQDYKLEVTGEMPLPKLPFRFPLPVLAPQNVIRASGFVLLGTDSAVKLNVGKALGLTQVDPSTFIATTLDGENAAVRVLPARTGYVYQYASAPYAMELTAEDIVTALSADDRLVLTLANNELTLNASFELDIKDAPARELVIETDPDPQWTVTSITGQFVAEADTDVRDEPDSANGRPRRVISVPFKQAVSGTTLVSLRLERTLKPQDASFDVPALKVRDARAERGYLVLAAEKGIHLKVAKADGLREVHASSTQMRVDNAQQAFRFKEAGWRLKADIERAVSSVDSEAFHLVSLGEGLLYGSVTISYHVGGAPLQELVVRVPAEIETIEFTGADIEGWTRQGDLCTVRLQSRVMGDYNLVLTYDKQLPAGTTEIALGGVETVGTESEAGYLAVASAASLELAEAAAPDASTIRIEKGEIPTAYSASSAAPILRAYRYVRSPHAVRLKVVPLPTEQLLGQIADYVRLFTQVSRDGEAVTTATYFIKNARRQYLVVRLPEGVKLWTVKQVAEDGSKQDALAQQSGATLYIPVARLRDPNTSMRLEVVYAQSHGKLGFWRTGCAGITLLAPDLPDAHATFAGWRVDVPEKFAVAAGSGNMTPQSPPPRRGLGAVVGRALRLLRALLDGPGGRTLARAAGDAGPAAQSAEFTKTVLLQGSAANALRLLIVPAWVGAASAPRLLLGLAAAGVIFAAVGWRRRRPAAGALGLTLFVLAAARTAAGETGLAAILLFAALAAIVWALVALTRAVIGGRRRRRARRRAEAAAANRDDGPPPLMPTGRPPPLPANGQGHGAVALLLVLGALGATGLGATAAQPAQIGPPPAGIVADSVEIQIAGPKPGRSQEQSAAVKFAMQFKADGPARVAIADAAGVLTGCELGSSDLRIENGPTGYFLTIARRGAYAVTLEQRVPVSEENGWKSLRVLLPTNLSNRVTLSLAEKEMEVKADAAVLLRTTEAGGGTSVEAAFGPVSAATLAWRPRVRTTKIEQVVFYAEVASRATLRPGVAELTHAVRCQIAQGEMRELKVLIPPEMSVTAVRAPGLATWSFDPATHALDLILERAVSGDFSFFVVTQVACEGLPYTVRLGAVQVAGASRQRGAVALAAPESVQVRVDESAGVSGMNLEDFPAAAALGNGPQPGAAAGEAAPVRRAFRYDTAGQVALKVTAEKVLPELRVTESGIVSIADERTMLATRLGIGVAKAGIFAVTLGLPPDFDVESLSGPDVSHWDEMKDGGHGVVVHFNKQIGGVTTLDLVLARTEKGIEQTISLPRVTVQDAHKHRGRLTVSGERGVRMMVEKHEGVDLRKAADEGIRQAGVLVFDLLRPEWTVILKTEVMAPLVKPEVLQVVDLTEGMLQCKAYIRYTIENAGVKSFRLKAPPAAKTLTVSGRTIAGIRETDKEQGIWQVDLHGKVENGFALTVSYQVPYDPAQKSARIASLQTLDTEPQRGYLVVTGGGRVEVEPQGSLAGLTPEDARAIPPVFGAGDLSSAIRCYRTLAPDYVLPLSVVRHDAAKVLPATINRVQMTSVAARSGKLLTRVTLQITPRNLRLLNVSLPNARDALWTALVNGKEVRTSRDGARYCIPLEERGGEDPTTVEMLYAGAVPPARSLAKWAYVAPKFGGLPLRNVEWTLYVQPGFRYFWFGGSMEKASEPAPAARVFDAEGYVRWNKEQRAASLRKARERLDAGEAMTRAGRQEGAKQAFQQAMNYSQGQADLNEDARVQLRNVQKQQVKMGLLNRRAAMRSARNIFDEQPPLPAIIPEGEFSQELAHQVEQALPQKANDALDVVVNRIVEQPSAGAGAASAISVTMPEQGVPLTFRRSLQIDPEGDLTVVFHAGSGRVGGVLNAAWPAALLFGLLWLWLARRSERATASRP